MIYDAPARAMNFKYMIDAVAELYDAIRPRPLSSHELVHRGRLRGGP